MYAEKLDKNMLYNKDICITNTLLSEIVRTVLVSAIKNHC